MSWIEIIADRKIRDAQEEGAFDDLPGKGKPLQLDSDPRVPPELRAAYRLMKEARVLPDWIELDKEVRGRQEKWAARVESFAAQWAEETARTPAPQQQAWLDRQRDLLLESAVKELKAQNALIDRLNLIAPTPGQQRVRLDVRAQAEALEARFPRFHPLAAGEPASWTRLLDGHPAPTRLANRMPLKRKRNSIG